MDESSAQDAGKTNFSIPKDGMNEDDGALHSFPGKKQKISKKDYQNGKDYAIINRPDFSRRKAERKNSGLTGVCKPLPSGGPAGNDEIRSGYL